jgi:hypothetical protein
VRCDVEPTGMTRRLLAATVLVLASTALFVPAASAAPDPCIQYNDPIHMGSYPVCPLDLIRK